MALVTVPPTRIDIAIANAVAAHTGRKIERVAGTLTWGADEKILCALAAGWWLCSRHASAPTRRASDHVLLTTLTSSLLPHILKAVFDQERPDRRTVRGHWRGIPFSGNKYDSFPSGHAVHIGALASAADRLPPRRRNIVWGIAGGLVLTRIILLAHWTSDVVAGLAMGVAVERALRLFTGFGRSGDASADSQSRNAN